MSGDPFAAATEGIPGTRRVTLDLRGHARRVGTAEEAKHRTQLLLQRHEREEASAAQPLAREVGRSEEAVLRGGRFGRVGSPSARRLSRRRRCAMS